MPNTTFEAAPSSPPRDLTVVPVEENPSAINLNWQPPKQPNGQITGKLLLSDLTDETRVALTNSTFVFRLRYLLHDGQLPTRSRLGG